MTPTPHPELNHVLDALAQKIAEVLTHKFVGFYLQGSFALGDHDEHSDVDFIVVLTQEPSAQEVEALQRVHGQIFAMESPWAQHLEGSYFPQSMLADLDQTGQEVWYLDHGADRLVRSSHCNTLVVRWVMHNHGVALCGPAAKALVPAVPTERFRAEVKDVIVDWGAQLLANPDRYKNRFYQGFIILTFCRMLRDLHMGTNASKQAGARWVVEHWDSTLAGLIERAWLCRPDPAARVREPADPDDYEQAMALVKRVREAALAYEIP